MKEYTNIPRAIKTSESTSKREIVKKEKIELIELSKIDNVNQLLSKEHDDLKMNIIYGSSKGYIHRPGNIIFLLGK